MLITRTDRTLIDHGAEDVHDTSQAGRNAEDEDHEAAVVAAACDDYDDREEDEDCRIEFGD